MKAQGTVEYLIIIAVIIVLAIGVIILILGTNDSGQILADSSNENITNLGPISITESAVDSSGDGIIHLQNNSGETFTITQIYSTDDPEAFSQNYDLAFRPGGINLELTNLDSFCSCTDDATFVTCNLALVVTQNKGLEHKYYFSTKLNCVPNISVTSDTTSPVVALLSPANDSNVFSRTVEFDFNVNDVSDIARCELFVNGVSDTNKTSGLLNGVNTIQKTFTTDKLIDWNVSCYDTFANRGNSSTFSVNIDKNQYQITTCLELQEIENDLDGNYELMHDIDCSDSINWGVAGFNPIGTTENKFTGNFNGKGHTISDLYIYLPDQDNVGLFGVENSPLIQKVGLVDFNITGSYYVGGLVGFHNSNGIIENTYSSGTVSGVRYVGGLVGDDYYNFGETGGTIRYSYSDSNVYGTNINIGGFIGYSYNSTIRDSFSVGTVNSSYGSYHGGFIGSYDSTTLTNIHWYNAELTCSGYGNPTCTKASGYDYFEGNVYASEKEPFFSDWNFDTIWQETSGYPTLR